MTEHEAIRYNRPPDFEAEVHFLTPEAGGRTGRSGPVRQGYLCDVHWDDDSSDVTWMIWPGFLDESGQEFPKDTPIPESSIAHFYIVSNTARAAVYQQWLREGAPFHLTEGAHRVAACRVTKILRLLEDAAVPQSVPAELETSINRQVFDHVEGLSAHSDVAQALTTALQPLGDVQVFCPDPQRYRYVVASTKGIIIAFAVGMDTTAFRLDERMKARALASGGMPYPECGDHWVSFTLFRDDWPKVDLEFWARKAYVAARELER
jgi:hypothetical protein